MPTATYPQRVHPCQQLMLCLVCYMHLLANIQFFGQDYKSRVPVNQAFYLVNHGGWFGDDTWVKMASISANKESSRHKRPHRAFPFSSTWSTCWRYIKLSLLPINSMLLSRRLPSSGAALWVKLFVLPPLVSMIGFTSYTLRYPLILRQVLCYQELSLYYKIASCNARRWLLFSSLSHCIPWTRRRRNSLSDWPGWRIMSLQDIASISLSTTISLRFPLLSLSRDRGRYKRLDHHQRPFFSSTGAAWKKFFPWTHQKLTGKSYITDLAKIFESRLGIPSCLQSTSEDSFSAAVNLF